MFNSVLNQLKDEFENQISEGLKLIQSINQIRPSLQQNQIYHVYELSFLKIFLSWEWFIEKTFILYMMGIKTDNDYCPKTYLTPRDEDHAYAFINEGRPYADWTELDTILRKANLFFDNGEPYQNALHSLTTDIVDMKTIRNAIVHMSSKAQGNFESLLRRKFGHAMTAFTPGKYLSELVADRNYTYISYYSNQIKIVSAQIIK